MGRAAVVGLALWLTVIAARGPAGGAAVVVPRWRVAGEGRGVPAVFGSIVYFLTKRHEVVAVEASTGVVIWRRSTGEPGDETLGSSVLVSGGVVMAGDYAILGFDRATGAPTWRFDPPDGYGAGLYLGEVRDGLAFAGSPSGRLYAVKVSDGRVGWSAQVAAAASTTVFQPVVDDDAVVAGYSTFGRPVTGGLVVVDRVSGRERWRRGFPRGSPDAATGFAGGPVVTGDLVIAASGDGRIHGFDRLTGLPRWVLPRVIRPDGRTQDRDWRALAVSGSSLIAGSVTGVLTMFDMRVRREGSERGVRAAREKWRYAHPEGGSIALRITADERSVYVPHLGGILVALDIRDGRKRWEIGGFNDGFNWAPAVVGGGAYAAASRTGLFALPR
jgi:outer membrane protein assembly factor BamB